jgi:hypothetical protein
MVGETSTMTKQNITVAHVAVFLFYKPIEMNQKAERFPAHHVDVVYENVQSTV